ncbi:hypothetical protein ACVW00_000598 [Marmoricola sp. URHA0025 HA25]
MDDSARTSVTLMVRRTASVTDGQGNTFGIIDVHPDRTDPAILLGVRLASSGERFGRVLRLGDRIASDGLDLTVDELVGDEPAWLVLSGTVPTREGGS